ncbi:MAG: hypothetical protein ABI262_15320 [Microcoleus sp.]|jgi:hypothetical protein
MQIEASRSPAPTLDTATHAECLEFIRFAIVSADRQTALDIQGILKDCCDRDYADRNTIWQSLTPSEQSRYRELLIAPSDALECRF